MNHWFGSRSSRPAAVCFLLLATSGLGSTALAQSTLRWKFQEGQTLQVRCVQETDTVMIVNNRRITVAIENQMEMQWEVKKVAEDGSADLEQTFKRLQMKMQTASAPPIQYDSEAKEQSSPAAEMVAEHIQPVLAQACSIRINSRGEIQEVKLPPELTKALTGDEAKTWKSPFTKEGLEKTLRQVAVVLPEAAISKGDSWDQRRDIDSPLGRVQLNSKYTYHDSVKQDDRALEELRLTSELKFLTPPPGGLKLVDQQTTGKLLFDAAAGRLASSQTEQKMTTERLYRDQKIRVESTSTVTATVSRP